MNWKQIIGVTRPPLPQWNCDLNLGETVGRSYIAITFWLKQDNWSQRGFMGTIADDYNRSIAEHSVNRRKSPAIYLKGPIHDSDLQSQPQFPTATSTKFPVYGLQQPQPPPWLAGRCCGCCWSEFSDIWWAIWSSEARSDIVTIRELRFNWERLNRSVAACVGRPSTATATAIWLHIAVAVENRCSGLGP